ncbi:hypothetical protein ACOMHN_031169 [Nucella lapillus]
MASRQQMREQSKRSLQFSPGLSVTKEAKKKKTVQTELEGGRKRNERKGEEEEEDGSWVDEGQQMMCESKAGGEFDIGSIHEIVLTRVNETLVAYDTNPSSSGGDCSSVIKQLMPALATAVVVAVTEAMKGVVKSVKAQLQTAAMPTTREHRLFAALTRLTYDNDRLQQYTRKESLRIHGVKIEAGETAEQVETKALKVFTDAGVEVAADDIAAVHRAGKEVKGTRPILVKFMSRRKRRLVMEKKKNLKGKTGYERVFVNDDLTPLRARLLGFVKRLDQVERAWTVDGRIFCVRKSPPGLAPELRPKPVIIETPNDLFDKLGVDFIDYGALGLSHLEILLEED